MARSTGPILAVGGLTLVNEVLVNGRPFNLRVPVATGVAAGVLALIEKASAGAAVGLAYLALISVIFVRTTPSVPPLGDSFAKWWDKNFGGTQ